MSVKLAVVLLIALLAGVWALSTPDALAQSRARVVIEIVDSDDVVGPGDDVTVHIWVRSPVTNASYELNFFHSVGGAVVINENDPLPSGDEPERPAGITSGTYEYVNTVRLVVPTGTAHGRATLSAQVLEDGVALPLEQATLTIDDPGDPIGSARISTTSTGCKDGQSRTSTSLRTRENARLKLEVKNSRGNLTNDSDIKSIIISAAGGEITPCDGAEVLTGHVGQHLLQLNEDNPDNPDANASTSFLLKSIDRKPIHIDVHAWVLGADGSVRSNTLVVNFAGEASSIRVGKPSATLAARWGKIDIPVIGLDSDGNRDLLDFGDIEFEVNEGPEDADLEQVFTFGKGKCGSNRSDCEKDDLLLFVETPQSEGDDPEQAAHGDYEIAINLKDDPDDVVHTVTVQVVGEPVVMTLELLDGSDPAVRRIFTSTGRAGYRYGSGEPEQLLVGPSQTVYAAVTMRDADGVLVSNTSDRLTRDGVKFQIVGALDVSLFSTAEREIEDGVAYVRFLVAGEEGRSLVIATSRDLEAHASIVAREKARFGLDGLIKVNAGDYTTWIGQNSVRVAELWPLLASRGISSVLLYVGSERRWERYGLVEGREVPGSRDFLITYGDTLWLGG